MEAMKTEAPTKGFFSRLFGRSHSDNEEAPTTPEPTGTKVSRPAGSWKPSSQPVTLTTLNFQKFLRENPRAVIDFWASWCRPCKALSPMLTATARSYPGGLAVGKVNIDHEPSLAREWGVKSIPTLVIFCDEVAVGRSVGVQGSAVLRSKLDHALRHCAAE